MSDDPRRFARGLAVAGWLATVAVAAAVTLAAVSVLGSGIFGGSTRTMSQGEVARALAAASVSPEPGAASSPPAAGSSPASDATVISSAGGSVIARCNGLDAEVVSWTPAQGFRAETVERGPSPEVKVEFEADDRDVKVDVRCVDGRPTAEIDDDGDED
ncbi:MAG: hypothetical protein ACRDVN_10550 [Jiangellaceae bacterium]